MDTIENPQREIRLLWTGGWDSTYRLVELSRMDVTVQPMYGCDGKRDSMEVEKQTMEKILAALQSHPGTKAHLLPIWYISLDTIPENQEITRSFQTLRSLTGLGGQYEWLARLAREYPGLELCLENMPYGGGSGSILKYGRMKTEDGVTALDPEQSSPECAAVFGNFRLPIFHITEREMLANIRAWGYEDIMAMIWFCHEPLRGECCGMCRPCQQKMEGRMEYLLPPAAQRRYRIYKKTEALFGEFPARVLAKLVYRPFL